MVVDAPGHVAGNYCCFHGAQLIIPSTIAFPAFEEDSRLVPIAAALSRRRWAMKSTGYRLGIVCCITKRTSLLPFLGRLVQLLATHTSTVSDRAPNKTNVKPLAD